MIQQGERRPALLLAVLVVLGGLGILLVLGTPLLLIAVQAAREAAAREEAARNLAQIGRALQNYHARFANLAPTEFRGADLPHAASEVPRISLEILADSQGSKENAVEAVKHRLMQQVDECGLSPIKADLEKAIRPSIRMRTRRANDQQIGRGVSKIGGIPDLPEKTAWPQWKGFPLAFIAQVNMADVAGYDLAGALPQTGLLSFFYDARQETWGFDPQDRGSWRVLFFEGDPSTLRRAEPPKNLPKECRFRQCQVTFSTELTLPPWESIFMERLELTEKETNAYFDLLERTSGEADLVHRLLGHPNPIQGEMQLECQLTFHGVYTGNSSGYEDPQQAELEKGASNWQLLLQIDSDEENAGMMWGDGGRLYFWIRNDDLKKRDFENVWIVLQCY